MMKLTDKDYRIILYALTVVSNWNGRYAEDAAFLAEKFRWLHSPITNNKQLFNILNYGKKEAYKG